MMSLALVGPELPALARRAITTFIDSGVRVDAGRPGAPRAPVFVTLRSADGALRGCIGSLVAVEPDVAAETARSAVLAATRDPRFPPVSAAELDGIEIEVSVLMPEEPVHGLEELDPDRYGVIVRDQTGRQGLLLPQVPGIETPSAQVDIARRKAGIATGVKITLGRFEVHKFAESYSVQGGRSRV
jgi:AmmeMemoRadiSam system protein A